MNSFSTLTYSKLLLFYFFKVNRILLLHSFFDVYSTKDKLEINAQPKRSIVICLAMTKNA